jgi:hypothetical protein
MSERMQSLLSRAVEDQLSEQRQLAGALTDVKDQLNRVSDELVDLRARAAPDDRAALDERMASMAAEVREALRELGERLEGVVGLVTQRGEELAQLRSSVTELDYQVRSQGETLSGLAGVLEATPAASDPEARGRLAELESAVSQLGPMLGEVGVTTSEHASGLADLQQRFDTLAQAVQGMSTSLTQRAEGSLEISAVEAQLTALQEDMTALGSDVAGLVEGSVDRATVQAAADAATAAAARVGRMDDIAAQVADLRLHLSGPDGVAANVEQLRSGMGSVDEAALDDRVRGIVAAAVAESEQRLSGHVDDAVVALAEVLLRRRFPPGDASDALGPAGADAASDFEPSTVLDDDPGGWDDPVPGTTLDDVPLPVSEPDPGAADEAGRADEGRADEGRADEDEAGQAGDRPAGLSAGRTVDVTNPPPAATVRPQLMPPSGQPPKRRRGWFRGDS